MNFFYGRVSTTQQNLDRQIELADRLNIPTENRYFEKVSGSKRNRDKLNEMLGYLREGDVIYCESLSRISRNLTDLLEICELVNDKKASLISQKENEIDITTASGRLWLSLAGMFAQYEKDIRAERVAEGRAAKVRKCGRCGGRKPIDEKKLTMAISQYESGDMTVAEICETVGMNRSTLYRYLKNRGISRVE